MFLTSQLAGAFNPPNRAPLNLATHNFSLLIRGFELLTRGFELVTVLYFSIFQNGAIALMN